ncbi:NADH-dependent flavin oxidoreductase [Pectobacterium atrosepticum]|uniref:NADH-dependent flavin oxidoreductase n=1 Tax=Pectobacterium atrosepticum TaxID=29471 RepID=UPI0003A59301|nr:NADH-dependent flavin oxidoreductase [Pectobacterium atrosepticum]GKV85422.1 NADH-dependent flavin oxidoreductase [Pectobacterium carotovorum subsp. carotovorum]AIA71041.1 NADH:flavin oxidoreductase [Pectobacterium atrosepticum]AIK14133.1 putative NADH-dependent flavin oxidoreductase [Pectobacterium atrosepticum]ATY90949.1 NADH:flavin oxidoreductase [Pectobacterium atrosepticum]KFX14174.1 NADH:flavin oxidoreductase [Pectobacterium atrosepticum]
MKHAALFEKLSLGQGITLRNRIVMAPMTTWSGNDDGTVSEDEEAYYRLRVKDIGLVITGCTHVQENGIGFTGEFAAYDDKFIPSLKRLAAAAKSGGAPAILQVFHAGVKTRPDLVSDIVAASAVPGDAGPSAPSVTPRELQNEEVLMVVQAFGEATRRAIEAGFDGVELHGAHGFLLQNFFSPHFNQRTDCWGGSPDNRMRFPLAVASEVRKTISEHATGPFLLGYRITLDESHEDGLRIKDSLQLIDNLIDVGINYLHVSLGNALEARPVDGPNGPKIIEIVRDHLDGRIPFIAAGQIRTPEQADDALAAGLSLAAIGQGLVMNPDWVRIASGESSDPIALDVAACDVESLAIPRKLWGIIEDTTGWFNVR